MECETNNEKNIMKDEEISKNSNKDNYSDLEAGPSDGDSQEWPFKPHRALGRSPPTGITRTARETALTQNAHRRGVEVNPEYRRSQSLDTGNKRKKMDTSYTEDEIQVACPMACLLKETIGKIVAHMTQLDKLVAGNVNTKREIKEKIESMRRQVEVLKTRNVQNWLQEKTYIEVKTATKEIAVQTDNKENTPGMFTHSSTQTPSDELIEICTYDQFNEIKNKSFPDKLYTNTELVVGNPLATKEEAKVILIEPEDPNMMQSIQRLYRDKFPTVANVTKKIIETYEIVTTVKVDGKEETNNEKIYKITHDGTNNDIWNKINKLKDIITEKCIAMHHIKSMSNTVFRNLVEVVFHGSQTKVAIYTTKGKNAETNNTYSKNQEPKTELRKPKPERDTYALILAQENHDPKELLKKIKTKLGNTDETNIIRSIRQTKGNKLIITTDKNIDIFKKLTNKIKGDESNLMVQMLGENSEKERIYVRGMDLTTTKEELKTAIENKLGYSETNTYQISELRENKNGTQSATIIMNKTEVPKLSDGRFKVGLVDCSVEADLKIRRCFRCWAPDHTSARCNGPDRRSACLRCGEHGHKAEECKSNTYCVLCEEEGHRTARGPCKNLRKVLNAARKEKKRADENKMRQEIAVEAGLTGNQPTELQYGCD